MRQRFDEKGDVFEMITRILLNLFKELGSFVRCNIEFFHKRTKLKGFCIFISMRCGNVALGVSCSIRLIFGGLAHVRGIRFTQGFED